MYGIYVYDVVNFVYVPLSKVKNLEMGRDETSDTGYHRNKFQRDISDLN